jgi:hypothetical protein
VLQKPALAKQSNPKPADEEKLSNAAPPKSYCIKMICDIFDLTNFFSRTTFFFESMRDTQYSI